MFSTSGLKLDFVCETFTDSDRIPALLSSRCVNRGLRSIKQDSESAEWAF